MRYTLFQETDKERTNPVEWQFEHKPKKGEEFEFQDVTYKILKRFKRKTIKHVCLEVKMVRYKIPNTSTSFSHKCPYRKNMLERLPAKKLKELKQKYGDKRVNGWVKDGKVKMHGMKLVNVCPFCECAFYKDKVELPEKVEVISLKGKKLLRGRK